MSELAQRPREMIDGTELIASGERVPLDYCIEAAAELDRLTAEVAGLKADAERYRWLRVNNHHDSLFAVTYLLKRAEYLDAAIDAALAAQEPTAQEQK